MTPARLVTSVCAAQVCAQIRVYTWPALKRFLNWGLSSGQSYSSELGYIALPPEIVSLSQAALARIE